MQLCATPTAHCTSLHVYVDLFSVQMSGQQEEKNSAPMNMCGVVHMGGSSKVFHCCGGLQLLGTWHI